MAIKREMPEREGLKVSKEVEDKVIKRVEQLRAEGFEFGFEDTPDTYVITTLDKDGKEKRTHLLKIGGILPSAGDSYKIEDFIEARLRYPDDDINIAVRKLKEEME